MLRKVFALLVLLTLYSSLAMAAPVIEFLELTSISDNNAIVTWRTSNEASNTSIEYGIGALTNTLTISESTFYHWIELDNLYPNVTYTYRVRSGSTYGPEQTFTTLSQPTGDYLFTFAVLADLQYSTVKDSETGARGRPYKDLALNILTSEVASISNHDPDFVVILGDVADFDDGASGNTAATYLKNQFNANNITVYATPGNHDKKTTYAGNWVTSNMGILMPSFAAYPANSYINYNFDHRGYNFIVLDSITFEGLADPDTGKGIIDTNWLNSAISASAGKNTFIFTHYAPYDIATTGMSITLEAEEYAGGGSIPLSMEVNSANSFRTAVEDSSAKIVGVVNGHVHDNFKYNFSNAQKSFPYIREASAVQFPVGYSIYKVYTNGYIHTFYKSDRTVSQLARNYITDEYGQSKNIWQQIWLGPLSSRNFTHTYAIADSTPPQITITSPASGSTQSNQFNLSIIATDESYLDRVEFFIDGTFYATQETAGVSSTLSQTINTLSFNNGSHTVEAKAFDTSSNSGSQTLNYTFNNNVNYPVVKVLSPNGSEDWESRSTQTVQWSATVQAGGGSLPSNPISIYYSTNNGSSYTLISSGLSNSGTYTWTVPDADSIQAKVKVICLGSGQYTSSDESNSAFTLAPYDTDPPQGSIIPILNNITQSLSPTFTGIATDEKSAIASVECRVDSYAFTPASPLSGSYSSTIEGFVFVVPQTLSRGNHILEARFKDAAGNQTSGTQNVKYSFTIIGEKPVLELLFDGVEVIAGDSINASPSIEAIVTSISTLSSINISINDQPNIAMTVVPHPTNTYIKYGFYTPTTAFVDGEYSIRVEAADVLFNVSSKEVSNLIVGEGEGLAMQGAPLNYPNPFEPASASNPSGGTYISYQLSKNSNITLSIHDLTGTMIWKQSYPAGSTGGRVGYNEVFWNGQANNGSIAGNGIYIYVLVGDGSVIGKGKVTVIK